MQQDIGSPKVTTWVQRIISLNLKVKSSSETGGFTGRLRSLFNTGKPLDADTRRLMEPVLGSNLEDVRTHGGYQAEETARQLGAQAFTYKGHVFGPDRDLDTSTREGLKLMAHELTHAVQQTQPQKLSPGQTLQREGRPLTVTPEYTNNNMVIQTSPGERPSAGTQTTASGEGVTGSSDSNQSQSSSEIDRYKVADRVYHLMQRDLVIERERVTRIGG
ncbi:MAG: DUF4157 domain-containing protein [Dehalococcoidales bacterium]|nr:MAG: DUF4157 domain-containing protein [Dehalococcoidales bacterium]